MIVRVGTVSNEGMLVQIAEVRGQVRAERHRDPGERARPINPARALECGCVQVEEGFGAEHEICAGPATKRQSKFDIGTESPPGSIEALAPSLLETQPSAQPPCPDVRKIVERDLLARAVLHHDEIAG